MYSTQTTTFLRLQLPLKHCWCVQEQALQSNADPTDSRMASLWGCSHDTLVQSPLLVFGTSSMPMKPISYVLSLWSLWSLWHVSCEEALAVGKIWDWQRVGAQYAHPNGLAAKEQDTAVTALLLRRKRAAEVMEKLQQGKERHASWLPALKSVKLKAREKIFEDRGHAIALYLGHDASIAVSQDGHVVCVLVDFPVTSSMA